MCKALQCPSGRTGGPDPGVQHRPRQCGSVTQHPAIPSLAFSPSPPTVTPLSQAFGRSSVADRAGFISDGKGNGHFISHSPDEFFFFDKEEDGRAYTSELPGFESLSFLPGCPSPRDGRRFPPPMALTCASDRHHAARGLLTYSFSSSLQPSIRNTCHPRQIFHLPLATKSVTFSRLSLNKSFCMQPVHLRQTRQSCHRLFPGAFSIVGSPFIGRSFFLPWHSSGQRESSFLAGSGSSSRPSRAPHLLDRCGGLSTTWRFTTDLSVAWPLRRKECASEIAP